MIWGPVRTSIADGDPLKQVTLWHSPAIAKLKVEPDFEDALVLLDGLGDGHLHLVAQEVGLLVARLDFRQDLLGVGRLKTVNLP